MINLHEMHHMTHNFQLWRMNTKVSRQIIRHQETETYQEYTLMTGRVKYLKEVQQLHLRLFKIPLYNWLVWLYRFRAPQLLTIALKDGKVVGYECFMFNEGEVGSAIVHELFVGVTEEGKGLATAMRKFSLKSYDFGNLNGVSTVAFMHDIKSLRSAQKAGFAIEKQSLKPPGHYLLKRLSLAR